MTGIYKITNLINNQCYIGQSVDIEQRWRREYSNAFNPKNISYNYPLSKDFRNFSKENFNFEILEECSIEELNKKEKYWIQYYQSFENGYNQTIGGEGFHKISSSILNNIINDLINNNLTFEEISNKYQLTLETIYRINSGRFYYQDNQQYPIRVNIINIDIPIKHAPNGYCQECGKQISDYACYCQDCINLLKRKVKNRPSKNELYNLLINNKGNFSALSKQYNVSDNAIRKWCKSYEIPIKSSYYKGYKRVGQFDLTNNLIQIFDSPAQASVKILNNKTGESNIASVCKGKRKTAYGYKWKYVE